MKHFSELVQSWRENGIPEDDELETAIGNAWAADSEPLEGKVAELTNTVGEKDATIAELEAAKQAMAADNYDLVKSLPQNNDNTPDDPDSGDDEITDLFENEVI